MSNNKKRSRKYSTTLRKYNTDTVGQGNLYYINSKGGFTKKDKMQVKLEGITIETYLKLYSDLQVTHRNLKTYLNNSNLALTAFLLEKGINTSKVNLSALIEELNLLLIIQDSEEYELLKVNGEGYVYEVSPIEGQVIYKQDKPLDYDKGYYKYVNGEYVVDEEMKLKLSQVVL